MKRLISVLLVLLGFGIGLGAGRFWAISADDQAVDRTLLYARAFDEAVAREAGPSTASLFRTTGPTATRATTGPILPCPLDQAALQEGGPGDCALADIGWKGRPAYCAVSLCLDITITEQDWRDPAVQRAARALARDPGAVCRLAERARGEPWRRDWTPGPVIDCGRLRLLRGAILLRVIGTRSDGRAGVIGTVRLS